MGCFSLYGTGMVAGSMQGWPSSWRLYERYPDTMANDYSAQMSDNLHFSEAVHIAFK